MFDTMLDARQRQTYLRYADLALPRHTSYPIVPTWKTTYRADDLRCDLARTAAESRPLSVYVHIPFCQKLCYYCACTKEIIPNEKRKQHDPAIAFLEGVAREAERLGALVGPGTTHQIHLGGGSPTFLNPEQLEKLWTILTSRFHIAAEAEVAIEIDPRITSRRQLETLAGLGFNRISLGIQDFDPIVQQAVNRNQPFEMVEQSVALCREMGFASVNFDLIYGLPFQTLATMSDTLDKTLSLRPDRIAFYRLAVIPEIFRWQNTFRHADLPGGEDSLALNMLAIERFQSAGYEFIGLDHFALPKESLADARRNDSLQRTFQGMTTGKGLDLIGLGPSAITMLDHAYAQNVKASEDWLPAVQADLPIERGLHLSDDDRVRRELLQQLYGHGRIRKRSLETKFGIAFDDYFGDELRRLDELVSEGLVETTHDEIRLTSPLGRLLARVTAAVFDRYLPREAFREGLPSHLASKVG
ncbi:MAG: oxygen-independent coproporphyrinogen III oxidase [Gemmataceae bacterium]